MIDKITVNNYNICVVDLWSVIDECYDDVFQNFNQYNIQVKTKITSDVKNLLLHHIIYNICIFLNKQQSGSKVVFYYDEKYNCSNIHTLVTHDFLQKIIKKISTILPIKVYFIKDTTFDMYKKMLQHNNDGIGRELILKLNNFNNNCDFTAFTFKKTLSFIKRHNLYLLDTQLLTDLKAKQLLLV
jgi:hypothetical protein